MGRSAMNLIVIHFARLGPYHLARLKSAAEVLGPIGWRVVALETAGKDATYAWEKMGEIGIQRRTVFKDRVFEEISAFDLRRGIFRELDELQPQAVAVAGWGTADARACLAWCKQNGAKAIVMSETRAADGRRVWWKEWIKSRLVRKFDGALCGGESHKRYLMDLGIPAERIAFGYNVVDNQFFGEIRNRECREQGNLTTEDTESTEVEARACLSGQDGDSSPDNGPYPYFLASNRFVERKNLKGLIRAYAKYVESFQFSAFSFQQSPGVVWPLVLLGDGELRGELEELCVEIGLKTAKGFSHGVTEHTEGEDFKLNSYKLKTPAAGGLVVFAGFRQIEELPAFYSGAGAFVHPALEEPWGLVINEAMASGLPVLSSRNVGAAEELVVEGKTGYLFDPNNIEEMAGAMAKVSTLTIKDRMDMGRAALEMVERKAPVKAFGEGLAKLLGKFEIGIFR